jgi:hypothetical protein
MKKLKQALILILLTMTIITFYITPAMADHLHGLKHAKGSGSMHWDEECLDYITLKKPKSEKHKISFDGFKKKFSDAGFKDSDWKMLFKYHHAIYQFMKSCNIKSLDLFTKKFSGNISQPDTLCFINLVKRSGKNEEFITKEAISIVEKYEMCSLTPKEDKFAANFKDPKLKSVTHSIAHASALFGYTPALYAFTIKQSQKERTIREGEFEDGKTAESTGPKNEFEAYEKSTSGVKLTCMYTTNQGSEKHVWSYSDKLYVDGVPMKDKGWSVSKKDNKNIFIAKGSTLGIPIEFFINFESSSSVETAAGVRIEGQCS